MTSALRKTLPPAAACEELQAELDAARQEIDELAAARSEALVANTRLVAELAFKNAELESWAYCVGHDLRAPLRAVEGFSRMLDESIGKQLDGEAAEYQRRVRRAAGRMEQRIAGLLELSRVGRAQLILHDVDVSALAREVADAVAAAAGGDGRAVSVHPALRARADRRLLRIALECLLDNAWKFTSRKSSRSIEIDRVATDAGLAYRIRDNGAGFDPAYAERLFSPFQRLHGDGEFPGLGIGLAMVDRVARRHGGRVWANGSVDGGAEILFTLAPRASLAPPP